MKKSMLTIMVLLVVLLSHVYAAVDPAWYSIRLEPDPWLASGTHDLNWGQSRNLQLGFYEVNRNSDLNSIPSWKNSDQVWGDEEKNLTFVITTDHPLGRLIHSEDPDKFLEMNYTLNINNVRKTITESTVLTGVLNWSFGSNILINVELPKPNKSEYEGSYTGSFTMEIYAQYDSEDRVKIGEETYPINVYYLNKSTPNQQIITNLDVVKYSAADNIDTQYLLNHNNSTNIGVVNFTSNDKKNKKFSIKISPKIDPLTGKFKFTHTKYNSTIFYQVFVPGKTRPQERAFSVPFNKPKGNESWNDSLEIAITRVSMPIGDLLAGEYTSTIVVELESD